MPKDTKDKVKDEAPPSGRAVIIFSIAGSSARGVGRTLRLLDRNDTGADDVGGKIADLFGAALESMAGGDVRNYNSYLKAVADVIYTQQGYTIPEE